MRLQRTSLFVLLLCLGVSLFCLLYPIYVIRPFRHQGAGELRVALAVLLVRPVLMWVCAGLVLVSAWWYCRTDVPRWRRIVAAAGAVAICGSAALARVNVYELMFHPAGQPSFTPAGQVQLDADEMVIAVRVEGQARAYPIRSISYHHIINDVVNGRPITATY